MENSNSLSNMDERLAKRARITGSLSTSAANECTHLYFVLPSAQSLTPASAASFPPTLTHQIFGREEEIQGYIDLAVNIWFSQRTFQALIELQYAAKQPGADDVVAKLQEHFPGGVCATRTEFEQRLADQATATTDQLGQPVWSQQSEGGQLEVFAVQMSTASEQVKVGWCF